jgi:hypothetical protein
MGGPVEVLELDIVVEQADGLAAKDSNFLGIRRTSDPYVMEVRLLPKGRSSEEEEKLFLGKTPVVMKNLSPVWKCPFSATVPVRRFSEDAHFELTLYDWDRLTEDDLMGVVQVNISIKDRSCQNRTKWYAIQATSGQGEEVSGRVQCTLTIQRSVQDPDALEDNVRKEQETNVVSEEEEEEDDGDDDDDNEDRAQQVAAALAAQRSANVPKTRKPVTQNTGAAREQSRSLSGDRQRRERTGASKEGSGPSRPRGAPRRTKSGDDSRPGSMRSTSREGGVKEFSSARKDAEVATKARVARKKWRRGKNVSVSQGLLLKVVARLGPVGRPLEQARKEGVPGRGLVPVTAGVEARMARKKEGDNVGTMQKRKRGQVVVLNGAEEGLRERRRPSPIAGAHDSSDQNSHGSPKVLNIFPSIDPSCDVNKKSLQLSWFEKNCMYKIAV